jgi:hypothetical protein
MLPLVGLGYVAVNAGDVVSRPAAPGLMIQGVRSLLDSRYWRDRAEEATTMADAMRDPVARQLMLDVAREYQELEKRAEQQEQAANHAHPS